MAVTTQKSTQLTNLDATPRVPQHAVDHRGKLRFAYFDFTQSGVGDANSTVDLVKLPAGRVRVHMSYSRIHSSAWGTGTTCDIGHTAYTNIDGDTVAADADELVADADVAAAGLFTDAELASGTGVDDIDSKLYESKSGVLIQAAAVSAGIPDGATMRGVIAYTQE